MCVSILGDVLMLKHLLYRMLERLRLRDDQQHKRARHIEDVDQGFDNIAIWLYWAMSIGLMALLCVLGMTCAWYADLNNGGF